MLVFLRRLRARVKYWNHERDVVREIEVHRAMAEEALSRRGISEQEARWRAARQLGNTTLARETSRNAWTPRVVEQMAQDLRYGRRSLIRRPTMTLVAVATLVLGLGLTGCLMTVFNAAFLRPWQVGDARRVVAVTSTMPSSVTSADGSRMSPAGLSNGVPPLAMTDVVSAAQHATYAFFVAATFRVPFEVSAGLPLVRGAFVSDNFFEIAQLPLQLGAGFGTGERGTPVAVISDGLWRAHFGADPAVVGRTTTLDRVTVTIAGVLPATFRGLPPAELSVVVPASAASAWPRSTPALLVQARAPGACCLDAFARLRPGSSVSDARQELSGLFERYLAEHALPPASIAVTDTSLASRRGIDPQSERIFALLGAGCVLVLLLSCVNVANLELARGLHRHRELQVRVCLGAARARIIRQLLTEGLLLASIAGLLAYGVAWLVPPILMRRLGGLTSVSYTPDMTVGIAIGLAAFGAAMLFSLAPALQSTRRERRNPAAMAPPAAGRGHAVILAAQLALSTVLILSGTLLTRSVTLALHGFVDFALNDVSVVQVSAPDNDPDFQNHLQLRSKWAALTAALSANRVRFAATTVPPIESRRFPVTARSASGRMHEAFTYPMAAAGLPMLGIRLVAGRLYADDATQHEVVVNQLLAEQLWPDGGAIGQELSLKGDTARYLVVGVTKNAHLTSLGELRSLVHLPLSTSVPIRFSAVIPRDRGTDDAVRRTIATVDSRLSVSIKPLADDVRPALENAIQGAWIAGTLGALALVLAVLGVYGVFALTVEERRRDIGVRVALGANPRNIAVALISAARSPIVSGIVTGLMLSLAAGQQFRAYLLGIASADPLSYVIVVAIVGASAMIAIAIPMRRALRVDPAVTLRQD